MQQAAEPIRRWAPLMKMALSEARERARYARRQAHIQKTPAEAKLKSPTTSTPDSNAVAYSTNGRF
jgi:hypothetical protein